MKKIGLIVNPRAGMGGRVGLKGTDGDMYKKSLKMGAEPVTPERTREFLSRIKNIRSVTLLTAPGEMGEEILRNFEISFSVVGSLSDETGETSADDTKRIAREMVNEGIDLLVFVGGDGTGRDIYDAVGLEIPVLAVPSGVKMFSSIFAVSARAAGEMLDAYVNGIDVKEEEVLDIDEDAFRGGKLDSRLYGYLKVPSAKDLLQSGKVGSRVDKSARGNKESIAKYFIEGMDKETLYLFGPGTTIKAITDRLGTPKTLLGADAVYNRKTVGMDLNESDMLRLLETHKKVQIVISPIGGQGFIFGRGNKQFTPVVIKSVGKENIKVVGTADKLRKLRCLRVDTGSLEVDEMLQGYIKALIGYNEELMIEVRC